MKTSTLIALLALAGPAIAAGEPGTPALRDPTRGELLYATHCIACHDAQPHWRAKKLAADWPGLRTEVVRWQETGGLGWNEDDIREVTHYLNRRYYHYPVPY